MSKLLKPLKITEEDISISMLALSKEHQREKAYGKCVTFTQPAGGKQKVLIWISMYSRPPPIPNSKMNVNRDFTKQLTAPSLSAINWEQYLFYAKDNLWYCIGIHMQRWWSTQTLPWARVALLYHIFT